MNVKDVVLDDMMYVAYKHSVHNATTLYNIIDRILIFMLFTYVLYTSILCICSASVLFTSVLYLFCICCVSVLHLNKQYQVQEYMPNGNVVITIQTVLRPIAELFVSIRVKDTQFDMFELGSGTRVGKFRVSSPLPWEMDSAIIDPLGSELLLTVLYCTGLFCTVLYCTMLSCDVYSLSTLTAVL